VTKEKQTVLKKGQEKKRKIVKIKGAQGEKKAKKERVKSKNPGSRKRHLPIDE